MKIEIWSDIACPWCYIGKRRFERALAGFEHRDEVDVTWRSFELDPIAPRRHHESQAELLARKYGVTPEQARAMDARMTAEGAKEGIEFHFDRVQVGNTFDAHRLIHLAAPRGLRAEMVERLFRAYFTEGEALGETDVLLRLAAEVGIPTDDARAMLESDALAPDVRADEARAHALGIHGVPFFAVDERYGISGAQPTEVLAEALRQIWSEGAVAATAPADGCDEGECAV